MALSFTDETVVVAASEPVSTSLDGEEVILHPGTGTYHGLNGIGTAVWQRISEPTTVDEIATTIAAEHDVAPDQVRSDITSFLRDLHAADLIRVDDQSS